MSFSSILGLYALVFILFAVIDLVWLGIVIKDFINNQLGHLRGDLNWYAVVLFYLLYPMALMVFAVYPAARGGSVATALLLGALFGFFAYMTYDLTNLATLKGWPTTFVIADIIWGTIVSAVAAGGALYLYQLIT